MNSRTRRYCFGKQLLQSIKQMCITPPLTVFCIFTVCECILLRMYQIRKYKQPSFATVLQRALLYTYITTTPDDGYGLAETCRDIRV
jgi:hypothetical protein